MTAWDDCGLCSYLLPHESPVCPECRVRPAGKGFRDYCSVCLRHWARENETLLAVVDEAGDQMDEETDERESDEPEAR